MASQRSETDLSAGRPAVAPNIQKLIADIVESLPVVDARALDAAVAELKGHPGASLHYLFESFTSADAATRAIVARVLAECGGDDVIDNLNAVIFDAAQDAHTKVLANDLLAELGHAVDPDVFAMGVPDAETLRQKLPSRALHLLAENDVAAAVDHARSLDQADRCMIILTAASRYGERARPLLKALAEADEADAFAVAGTISSLKLAAGAPLLIAMQRIANKPLQKLIKKALFGLRKAGVAAAEEKPRAEKGPAGGVAESQLEVYGAMMSEARSNEPILVILARVRPNGRLKVFTALVDFSKRGIQEAVIRLDMSKSSFDRFVTSQARTKLPLRKATVEECRRVVARGFCVAKEFGSRIPVDFSLGKQLLGDMEAEVASIENPFLCATCGKALDAETVEKIRAAAPYDNIPVETRCVACRGAGREPQL